MPLTILKTILAVPSNPLETTVKDWEAIEKKLGTVFPDDYKEFISCYGTGEIDEFLFVLNPVANNKYVNLFSRIDTLKQSSAVSKQMFGTDYIPPLFPESGGYLPFAYTANGDDLYWATGGNPDEWPVVVFETRSPEKEQFNMTMASFLAGILSGNIRCGAFPDDAFDDPPIFTP
jgi:hypothetical protein